MADNTERFIELRPGDERKTLVMAMQGILFSAGFPVGDTPGKYDHTVASSVWGLQKQLGVSATEFFDEATQLALYNKTGLDLLKLHDAFHPQARRKVVQTDSASPNETLTKVGDARGK